MAIRHTAVPQKKRTVLLRAGCSLTRASRAMASKGVPASNNKAKVIYARFAFACMSLLAQNAVRNAGIHNRRTIKRRDIEHVLKCRANMLACNEPAIVKKAKKAEPVEALAEN